LTIKALIIGRNVNKAQPKVQRDEGAVKLTISQRSTFFGRFKNGISNERKPLPPEGKHPTKKSIASPRKHVHTAAIKTSNNKAVKTINEFKVSLLGKKEVVARLVHKFACGFIAHCVKLCTSNAVEVAMIR
jgi:translation initiation factor 1 (eIF-1/SUI1)